MVEKRDPALDRCGHAHLILLHKQLVKVSLDVRIQELRYQRLAPHARQRPVVGGIGIDRRKLSAQFGNQKIVLGGAPKHREIVEIQLIKIRPAHEEGARGPLTKTGSHRQSLEDAAQAATCDSRQVALVESAQAGVVFGHGITIVARERLIAALASEHDLDVTRGQPRHEIECDARGMRDRLILVPHQTWQLCKELRGRDDDLAMLGAKGRGDEPGIFELVGFALGKGNREVPERLFPGGRLGAGVAAESNPPERNIPSGTSLMRRRRTASVNRWRYSSTIARSAGEPGGGASSASAKWMSQYWRMLMRPFSQVSVCPGGSRMIPANSVASPEGA